MGHCGTSRELQKSLLTSMHGGFRERGLFSNLWRDKIRHVCQAANGIAPPLATVTELQTRHMRQTARHVWTWGRPDEGYFRGPIAGYFPHAHHIKPSTAGLEWTDRRCVSSASHPDQSRRISSRLPSVNRARSYHPHRHPRSPRLRSIRHPYSTIILFFARRLWRTLMRPPPSRTPRQPRLAWRSAVTFVVLCSLPFPPFIAARTPGRIRWPWTTVLSPSGTPRPTRPAATRGRCPSHPPSRYRHSSSPPPCRTTFSPRRGRWRAALYRPHLGPLTRPRQSGNEDVTREPRHRSCANAE